MPPSVLGGRIVTPGQPLWEQQDTDLAIALTELDSERCGGCGQSRLESMDRETEFSWRAEAIRCHSCATRERAARANNGNDGWDGAGITWLTRRIDA